MSTNGSISFVWGDGEEHKFRLAIGQLRELQEKCAAGPRTIFDRLCTGGWYVDDIRETLRLGLIGGGKTPIEAMVLVKRYVDDRPLQENVMPAMSVIMAAVVGSPDDQVGKEPAETTETEATGALSSPPSTAPAAPSAGRRGRLTN